MGWNTLREQGNRRPSVRPRARELSRLIAISFVSVAVALPAAAQFYGGPPATTTIGGHALAPPASVTSLAGQHSPNALPSVTSIPNYGFHYHYGSYFNGQGSYYGGRYRGGGGGYAIPYYYPVDNSAYGYDYVGGGGGGPDLYSGPPVGPNDPSLHMVVEQPPARPYAEDMPDPQVYASTRPPAEPPAPPAPPAEVKPADPTVLVFRNGKQQEVTNYAIMGDSLYVFDQGRKKIALADLDIPATIKANDDRGTEFRMPPSSKKKSATVPQTATPEQSTTAPANIATAMP